MFGINHERGKASNQKEETINCSRKAIYEEIIQNKRVCAKCGETYFFGTACPVCGSRKIG